MLSFSVNASIVIKNSANSTQLLKQKNSFSNSEKNNSISLLSESMENPVVSEIKPKPSEIGIALTSNALSSSLLANETLGKVKNRQNAQRQNSTYAPGPGTYVLIIFCLTGMGYIRCQKNRKLKTNKL